jgi:GNAT superfamily N-acetyltransferase
MPIRESDAAGPEALALATELLQRARRADPQAGVWEAADVQWWWRRPRHSDDLGQRFWLDDDGPVAGVLLTSWGDATWQCDPLVVPGASGPSLETVWARAQETIGLHAPTGTVEVLVRDDDPRLRGLVEESGFAPGAKGGMAWLDAGDRPAVRPPAAGYRLVDRTQRPDSPHPMRHRNGDTVAERLGQVTLYDPELDLAVETDDGRGAAYSLFWFDPTTQVGLVEPVRVEDDHQRRGLATAMLTAGLDRLTAKGADRVKIGFSSPVAATLYQGIGFRQTSSDTTYERRVSTP